MKMDANFLRYSALDSACTLEIKRAFWNDLSPDFSCAYDLTMSIFPVLMFMQTRGIKVNRTSLELTKVDVLKSKAEKQEELEKLCGRTINVNSSPDCQRYFYDELGIPPYRNKDGKSTTDDLALQRLVRGTVARPGLRQAKLVQDIRGLQKLFGTYLDLEFDADDRIRCSYNPRGTKFGRLSSSKTVFGTGTNLQNLPQEFKAFLVPDEGYVFLEVDKAQAEWVGVAYISGDANMIAAVEARVDVHAYTASQMFNVPPEVIEHENGLVGHMNDADAIKEIRLADPICSHYNIATWPRTMSLRQCGKKSNHGLNYDEGYRGFAMINEVDEAEAKRVVTFYHNIYPGIRIWYEVIKRQLQRDRTLTNCFGRSVRFLDAWNDQLWKSAYSMLPQSTIVDSLNEGMVKVYDDEWLCGKNFCNIDILAQVHDSVLMQVPIAEMQDLHTYEGIQRRIADYTSPTLNYNGRSFTIASDFKVGLGNWGGYHKERNSGGMRSFKSHGAFMDALTNWKNNGSGTVGVA